MARFSTGTNNNNSSFTHQMGCLLTAVSFLLVAAMTSSFVVPAPRPSSGAMTTGPASATRASPIYASARCHRRAAAAASPLRMSEEEVVEEAVEGTAAQEAAAPEAASQGVRSFFAPNENRRLGSSRDQDGKSNVWAIEPKMRVEGKDVEVPESGNFAVIGGVLGALVVVMAAVIVLLPAPDSL